MLNATPETPRVAVLGPVLIEGRDGGLIEPTSVLARALIVILAGIGEPASGRAMSVDAIADELWGDDQPRNARAALQTLVSRLRQVAADGIIRSTTAGYALDVTPAQTDAGIARAALHAPDADSDRVEAALALWRGEPGADLGDTPVRAEAAREAAALREQLLRRRARLHAASGDQERAAEDLGALAGAHPFDEGIQADYIAALHGSGRTQEALAAFAAYRTRLRDELGTSPGATLVELNARLLQEDSRPSARVRVGLRAAPNTLIGRDAEVVELERMLATTRVVTILGAGGLGKTRLAQEIAARSDESAVIVVELASVRTDDDVALALASTLGIREITAGQRLADAVVRPDLKARIIAQLTERPTLLVLDNCEQVVDAAALWCAELVAAGPRLHVLTTSRSPLAISAEAVFPLAPLPTTSDDDGSTPGAAVQLFLDRARAVRPAAVLPIDVVERLCTRLDGLPLAIELAAARVRSMTPEQIEARLEHRFALLTGGDRSAPERHRTLLAVIEWSWNLLRADEQAALRRLSLFPDGFSAEAAASVTGQDPVEGVLDALVAQSLLTVRDDASTNSLRYRMLETVREFGQEQLSHAGEHDTTRDALFDWATAYGGAAIARYSDTASHFAVRVEQDNLVSVLRQAMQLRRHPVIVMVFAALGYYWTVRAAHSEVVAFGPSVMESLRGYHPDDQHVDATVLTYILITTTALTVADTDALRASALLRRQLRERPPHSSDLRGFAEFLAAVPDFERASGVLERMRASTDASTALLGEMIASQWAENEGEFSAAVGAATRSFELARQLGDVWRSSMAAMMLAELASQSGDPVAALRWTNQAAEGMRLLDAEQDLLQIAWMRGTALLAIGRTAEARELLEDLVAEAPGTAGGWEPAFMGRFGLAELARIDGDVEGAVQQYRVAMRAFRASDQRGSPWFTMAVAGFISAGVFDGTVEPAELAQWAARLRSRTIGLHRARPEYIDKPVLGTAAIGWSAWALGSDVPELRERGLELLVLAEQLHARQDLPSLRLVNHLARAEELLGADAVEAARVAASALGLDERATRAHALIAAHVPR